MPLVHRNADSHSSHLLIQLYGVRRCCGAAACSRASGPGDKFFRGDS